MPREQYRLTWRFSYLKDYKICEKDFKRRELVMNFVAKDVLKTMVFGFASEFISLEGSFKLKSIIEKVDDDEKFTVKNILIEFIDMGLFEIA